MQLVGGLWGAGREREEALEEGVGLETGIQIGLAF